MFSSGYKRLNIQKHAIRFIPYTFGVRAMAMVFGWTWLQTTYFKGKWRLFRELEKVCPMDDMHAEFKVFLIRCYFRVWLVGAFAKLSPDRFEKVVKIEGLDTLERYMRSGQGVLLLSSNVGFGRLLAGVLSYKNIQFLSLDGGELMRAAGIGEAADIKLLGKGKKFLLRQLFDADKSLRSGKLVHSTGDGSEGSHGIERLFLGYKRTFKTSLLELAVKRDAVVMPVFVTFEGLSCLRIKFYDPLGDRCDVNVESILDDYVSLLEKHWLKYPGQISFGQMKKLLKNDALNEESVK